MTRRPYMPHAQKVSRASHLLTAPGKKWSESPTPRIGPDRPPRQAATPFIFVPVSPTFVQRDQRIPHTETTFELNDYYYSPEYYERGPYDKILCWMFVETVTMTPPSGWNVLLSGTLGTMQYWVAWLEITPGADYTVTYSAAPGYPQGYRSTHVVTEWFNGGNLVPKLASIDLAQNVSSRPTPKWDQTASYHLRQVQFIDNSDSTYTYGRWAGDWYSDYNYTTHYGADGIRDWFEYGGGLRYNGTHSWFSDSGRTTPKNMANVLSFAVGWGQP